MGYTCASFTKFCGPLPASLEYVQWLLQWLLLALEGTAKWQAMVQGPITSQVIGLFTQSTHHPI